MAWDEAEEDLGVTGLGRLRHETTTEYAGRVGPVAGADVAEPLVWLAAGTEAASWSRVGVAPEVATQAAVGHRHRHRPPGRGQPAAPGPLGLDPRPLLRRHRPGG